MTNHIHLLVTPDERESVAQLMMGIGRRYVRYINGKYRRTGTLWEGRFKSSLVDQDAYFLAVSRYIELNPVRANMVIGPQHYPWSSFHHNALGKRNELVTEHVTYKALADDELNRQLAYRKLFDVEMSDQEIKSLRVGLGSRGFVGNDRFREAVEAMLGRDVGVNKHGGARQ